MEEIISKSKAGKAIKAQQKEEDIVLQEELDDEFKELMEVFSLLNWISSVLSGC
jgi:hypothetical protein